MKFPISTLIFASLLFLGFSHAFPAQDHESRNRSDQESDVFVPLTAELKHTITI